MSTRQIMKVMYPQCYFKTLCETHFQVAVFLLMGVRGMDLAMPLFTCNVSHSASPFPFNVKYLV